MTSRAPHDQFVYGANNKTLWQILHDALKYHPSYPSIRYFTRTQNGRAAYLTLALHNLREYRNHTVLEEAEDNLNNVFNIEEKLKFTLYRFVKIYRSAHDDMLSFRDYAVPNPATRVRKVLSNIRSNNQTLLASITSVQTSTTIRNDFGQILDTIQSANREQR